MAQELRRITVYHSKTGRHRVLHLMGPFWLKGFRQFSIKPFLLSRVFSPRYVAR